LNVNRKIPVSFQKLEKFEIQADDTRFLPVKIWLMHLGENFNGSYFSKEVVEAAIPSLANTPILSYIEDNSDDELDFSDHRQVLVVKNDSFDLKYLGQAIGIIPESNNAQFEDRLCEDNVTRTFLTVEGLIWTKWDEPVDILNRDLFKAQSMELHSDYEGVYNEEDNMFHFSKFKFFGACGLGKDVLPAMINSTIEVNFNLDMFKQEIQDKMEQFKLALSNNDDRGGKIMDKKLELLSNFSVSLGEEVIEQVKKNLDSYSLGELEDRLLQMYESEIPVEEVVEVIEEEPIVEFDYKSEYEKLQEEMKSLREQFQVEKESAQEVLDKAISDFAKLQEDYTKLEDSAKELEQFKLSHVQKEREKVENELFANFINGFGLTDDDLSPIKEKKDSYSIEELEEKLFALAGRKKLSFSKTQEVKPIRYTLPVDNKPSNNKEWADLVEQHKNK
jgi:hypothetical protein